MSYWTHYWTNQTVREQQGIIDAGESDEFNHTASNLFRDRGITTGDVVYVVCRINKEINLIGRMVVGEVLDESEAQRRLGTDIWEASDHLIAKPPASTCRFDVVVPKTMLEQIEFINSKGTAHIKYDRHGDVDQQTLRGVREVSSSTAGLFDSLL